MQTMATNTLTIADTRRICGTQFRIGEYNILLERRMVRMAKKKASETNRNPRRDNGRLSSVTTAIHLLKTFDQDDYELGISELSKRLNVAKSTVHRLATALLDEGLLQQSSENGRYRLGIGLFSLGSLVRAQLDVTRVSRTLLNKLREATQENVRLAILEQDRHDVHTSRPRRIGA